MTPQQSIDMLDRAIARGKQTVTLRRLPSTDVTVPAMVRSLGANDLVGQGNGLVQSDALVIISPTQINAGGWPGPQVDGKADVRVPSKGRGDQVVIGNQTRSVQNANPVYMGDVLVRIEIQVR
jgi:hypothetical protein